MNAILALKDGTVFRGRGFGAEKEVGGEVVFNTSLVGYEEALTDPSYKGQILTMTYPLIGNYGVRKENFESDRIQVEGFVVSTASKFFQHRIAVRGIDKFLKYNNIPGIEGIDTRALTRKIRIHGVMNGVLITSKDEIDEEDAVKKAKKIEDISKLNLIERVSVKGKREFNVNGKKTVAIIDLGTKNSIIKYLNERGVNVILLPHNTKPDVILDLKVDGVFLVSGPGNPERAIDAIKLVKEVQSQELPIFGICLGHQVIGLGLGAKTYKLRFGHRGSNQPVKNLEEDRVYITSQNHSFAVEENSVDGTDLKVTMTNLNDKSVEGVCSYRTNTIHSVQFHPEASPGPLDSNNTFDRWIKWLK